MTRPGRLKTRGEGNAAAKLTATKASFIKQAASLGASQTLLARHFRISHAQVSRIINHVDWRHA